MRIRGVLPTAAALPSQVTPMTGFRQRAAVSTRTATVIPEVNASRGLKIPLPLFTRMPGRLPLRTYGLCKRTIQFFCIIPCFFGLVNPKSTGFVPRPRTLREPWGGRNRVLLSIYRSPLRWTLPAFRRPGIFAVWRPCPGSYKAPGRAVPSDTASQYCGLW